MARRVSLCLLCAMLLLTQAQAAEPYDGMILAHNRALAEQWSNARPAQLPEAETFLPLAAEITADCSGNYEKARAVHDWICENIFFDQDALAEGNYHYLEASELLEHRFSVCEGISNLAQALLLTAEIPCRKAWGYTLAPGTGWTAETAAQERANHTWVEVFADGRWFPVDCTMDLTNRYENGVFTAGAWTRDFFDPAEAQFARSHKLLRRAMDLPSEIPAPWAQRELAHGFAHFPLAALGNYPADITEAQLCRLLGRAGGADIALTRLQGVLLCAEHWAISPSAAAPAFRDVALTAQETQGILTALQEKGILRGTGSGAFSPNARLTRQEALVLLLRHAEKKGG